jgi:hypothetical protein
MQEKTIKQRPLLHSSAKCQFMEGFMDPYRTKFKQKITYRFRGKTQKTYEKDKRPAK